MSVYRVQPRRGEEPHKWKVEKFADIGTNEMFIRHVTELGTLIDATLIFGKQRDDAKHAVMVLLTDGLMPAFTQLEKIRASVGKDLPIMDRRELYNDFSRKLWKSYKDLMQRAATEIGFNIGFLFQNDKNFEKGLEEFKTLHPQVRPTLLEILPAVRIEWQDDFAQFRNTFLEHQETDSMKFAKFYNPEYVEGLFDTVWNLIVDFLAGLIETKFSHGIKLAYPDPQQMPNWPNRFVFDAPHFRDLK